MINYVYTALAVVFVIVVSSMVTYNLRLKTKRATLDEKGRLPISREEGILIATEHKHQHHAGKPGQPS